MAFDAWGHSWGGPFTRFVRWGAAEQVTAPQYGPPFLDRQSLMLASIGVVSLLTPTVGLNATMTDTVERLAIMASPRISRSARNE